MTQHTDEQLNKALIANMVFTPRCLIVEPYEDEEDQDASRADYDRDVREGEGNE